MTSPPAAAVPPRRVWLAVALTAVVLAVLDALWLGVVSGDLYRSQIGHLLAESFALLPAVLFYAIYVGGLVHFVVRPGLSRPSLGPSLRDAAVFGAVTYATFDLTSMAVMRDFPALVAVVDIAWGVTLCTVTTAVVLTLLRRRGRAPRTSGD
jgi:uncharacterized membrane protein